MAEREKDSRIEELYQEGRKIYSFSKLNTIDQCEYSAYQTYIKHDRGINSVYGVLGGKTHDTLEQIMNGTATKDELLPAIQGELDELDMLGLAFPKDFRGGDSIRNRWIQNMSLFARDFMPFKGRFLTEQLVIYRAEHNRALIGYADYIRFNLDGTVSIGDHKTSSWFKDEDLTHHGRQGIAYALGLEQMGYKVRDFHWHMLKFCTVRYLDKRGNEIVKNPERSKLFLTIKNPVSKALNALGIEELEQEYLMNEFEKTNSLAGMPQEIRDAFKVTPCLRYYELTDERKDEFLSYFHRTAGRFEELEQDVSKPWQPVTIDKSNCFFCNSLCGFRKRCPAIAEYNRISLIKSANDDDIF